MKKNNKRIFMLIILVFFMITLLLTSTYAWFNNNQKVEDTSINVKAKASLDMKISVDGVNWKSAITLHDIENAEYEVPRFNQIPSNFQAYSSIGELNDGFINMFHGFVSLNKNNASPNYGKRVLTAEKVKEVDGINGGFLSFDLYLKSDTSTNLYLGNKSYAKYVGDIAGIENTLRIAFVIEGVTKSSNANTIQSLKTTNPSNVIIWEPNYDTHTATAIEAAKSIYDLTISEINEYIPYYGVKQEITDPVLLTSTDPTYFSLMENNIVTPKDYYHSYGMNKLLFYLQEGITKIRVYAWVEGQDVDCENNAAGSDFEFNFNFTTKVKE